MQNKKYSEILKDIEKWESIKAENQGRTKNQVESNYKISKWVFISFAVMVIMVLIGKALNIW
jgi:hypothetical protein|tara:strand:- start:955 stop:1140 length:186 start_codon:yes stop_codon:yes gene_type:complete